MKEVLLLTLMVEVVSEDIRKSIKCLLGCKSQKPYCSEIYSRKFTFKRFFFREIDACAVGQNEN